ncbi:MAG: TetR/AcrR family transcriptional regulator [Acidimicrobiia bacterium]|nr:MAG: TetR/AcrR family transcriptional regulator [Acidimicrobiia bacterium]
MTKPTAANRREQLLEAAAACFSREGYDAASMRAIADEAGMRTASIYYHFNGKDDLLVAVHEEALNRIREATRGALRDIDDPWERLEAASAAHLEILLTGGTFFKAVMQHVPHKVEGRELIFKLRDDYENIFTDLVAALELPPDTERETFRLMLLGAMNWTFTWWRPRKGPAPDVLASSFIHNLRSRLDVS